MTARQPQKKATTTKPTKTTAKKAKQVVATQETGFDRAVVDSFRPYKARTENQTKLLEAIANFDIVFAVGPAGCGKTHLAVCKAVEALVNGTVTKIVITRPVVEAGEKLGFLPGSFQDKVDPYMRPIYDSLNQQLTTISKDDQWVSGQKLCKELLADGVIEIVPLAFMRGRTFNNTFVIFDESQNSTIEQMQMALTRLGQGSKMVVTGDRTQIDLPYHVQSGLIDALDILEGVRGIEFVELDTADIQRHGVVNRIVTAYAAARKYEKAS